MSKLGEVRNNSKGTPMKIIVYRSNNDIDIEFLDDFHYVKEHQTYSNFSRGVIKNPYDRTLYGVGYLGVGKYKARQNANKMETAYQTWKSMIERCYHNDGIFPSYYGKCEICEEWHNYQTFAEWFEKNRYECSGRLHIDKDILHPNCNLYSPENCLLVPQRINMLFMNRQNDKGLPNGIEKCANGYSAKYNGKELGVYKTLDEAFSVYANYKEKVIKEIANEYRNVISQKVYEALYAYKVDIKNDKNCVV